MRNWNRFVSRPVWWNDSHCTSYVSRWRLVYRHDYVIAFDLVQETRKLVKSLQEVKVEVQESKERLRKERLSRQTAQPTQPTQPVANANVQVPRVEEDISVVGPTTTTPSRKATGPGASRPKTGVPKKRR
jgi:hypothetical protein